MALAWLSKHLGRTARRAAGSGLDHLLSALGLQGGLNGSGSSSTTFTIAFISLAAKMAKADGCVSAVEAQTFAQIYQVDPGEEARVKRVFEHASGDTAGYETYARQIAHALAKEPKLLRDVFDGLFYIATADSVLHPGEDAFLRRVSQIFGMTEDEYRSIRATFVRATRSSTAGVAELAAGGGPYQVLGLSSSANDATIKARYRALARDLHPDSLTARGVPEQFHAASERKLAAINAAYDQILKERGLRGSQTSARETSRT